MLEADISRALNEALQVDGPGTIVVFIRCKSDLVTRPADDDPDAATYGPQQWWYTRGYLQLVLQADTEVVLGRFESEPVKEGLLTDGQNWIFDRLDSWLTWLEAACLDVQEILKAVGSPTKLSVQRGDTSAGSPQAPGETPTSAPS